MSFTLARIFITPVSQAGLVDAFSQAKEDASPLCLIAVRVNQSCFACSLREDSEETACNEIDARSIAYLTRLLVLLPSLTTLQLNKLVIGILFRNSPGFCPAK